jgi:hypothetical protein
VAAGKRGRDGAKQSLKGKRSMNMKVEEYGEKEKLMDSSQIDVQVQVPKYKISFFKSNI